MKGKECSMTLNEALHIARNPYGYNKIKIQFARDILYDFSEENIQTQQKELEEIDEYCQQELNKGTTIDESFFIERLREKIKTIKNI